MDGTRSCPGRNRERIEGDARWCGTCGAALRPPDEPTTTDDPVIVAADDAHVAVTSRGQVALFTPDGEPRWTEPNGSRLPAEVQLFDDVIAVGVGNRFDVHDVVDGALRWRGPEAASVHRVDDVLLFVGVERRGDGTGGGDFGATVDALDVTHGEVVWEQGPFDFVATDPAGVVALDGDRLRRFDGGGTEAWGTPLGAGEDATSDVPERIATRDGHLVAASDDRQRLFDLDDGREVDLAGAVGAVQGVDDGDVLIVDDGAQLIRDGEVAWEIADVDVCDHRFEDTRVLLLGCAGDNVEVDREDGTERARTEPDLSSWIPADLGDTGGAAVDPPPTDDLVRDGPLAVVRAHRELTIVDVRHPTPAFLLRASGQVRPLGAPPVGGPDAVPRDDRVVFVAIDGEVHRLGVDVPLFPTDAR